MSLFRSCTSDVYSYSKVIPQFLSIVCNTQLNHFKSIHFNNCFRSQMLCGNIESESHFLFVMPCIPILDINCVIMSAVSYVSHCKMLSSQTTGNLSLLCYTYLFLFSIFVIYIRQHKVNSSNSISEEHCVFVWL